MENSNNAFNEILSKLQETLNQFDCKSEIKLADKEALLYGKLQQYMERYSIVIHIKEENYKPVNTGAGKIKAKEEEAQKVALPNLNNQVLTAQKANCSEEEQVALRNKFIEQANQIGNEFQRKMNT